MKVVYELEVSRAVHITRKRVKKMKTVITLLAIIGFAAAAQIPDVFGE